jgi:hypothetical protein
MLNVIKFVCDHPFEVLVGVSFLIILIMILVRWNKKGTWSTNYSYVKGGAQRPRTAPKESYGEKTCREVLVEHFQRPFPNARPGFMSNPVTGGKYNLELDCYNDELKLAVEYNGEQHYNYIPFFHRNKEAFYNQKYRDEMKRNRCKELGITLIEVPYTEKNRIREYLKEKLKAAGF